MLSKFKRQLKDKGEIYLKIKVHPNAAKTIVKAVMNNNTVKVDIAAPPVRNKANQELVKFLAQGFSVSKNNVKIISGINDKNKLIKIKL